MYRVISTTELRDNMKKYLDLAKSETILIQRGRNETFVLTVQPYPVADISRALTREQLMPGITDGIKEMYAKGKR